MTGSAVLLLALGIASALAALAFAINYGHPARKAIEYYLRSAAGRRLAGRYGAEGTPTAASLRTGELLLRIAFTAVLAAFSIILFLASAHRII